MGNKGHVRDWGGVALLSLLLAVGAAGCGVFDGPSHSLSVRFAVARPGTASALAASAGSGTFAAPAASPGAADVLVITGTNGTLRITDLRLIVGKMELERVNGDCKEHHECEEVETPPMFVNVPLSGSPVTVAQDQVPPGSYRKLEFEVEDGELDEDEDSGQLQTVMNAVRAAFPDWPSGATAVVVGSFTPTGGAAAPFTVYLRAEIEVELAFNPPLVVADQSAGVTVNLIPEMWFKRSNGTVVDLSQFDFGKTHQTMGLEVEMEHGLEVEIEH